MSRNREGGGRESTRHTGLAPSISQQVRAGSSCPPRHPEDPAPGPPSSFSMHPHSHPGDPKGPCWAQAPPELHTISGLGSPDPSQQAVGCEACNLELAPRVWEDRKPSLTGRSRWAAGSRQDGVRAGGCRGRNGLGVSEGSHICRARAAAPLGPRALQRAKLSGPGPQRPAGTRPQPPAFSGGPGETGWARARGHDFL